MRYVGMVNYIRGEKKPVKHENIKEKDGRKKEKRDHSLI